MILLQIALLNRRELINKPAPPRDLKGKNALGSRNQLSWTYVVHGVLHPPSVRT
jgi:hypothetical protein